MGSLLKLITKLFGKNALGKTLGTRTNVIKLPNNEKKRLIKNELDIERASDAAAQKVLEEAKELIPDLPKMNDMERLVFEGNLRRLDNRLNPPSAEVVEFGTKKPMSEAGIKQLAAEKGFPEGVDPESTMGRLLTSTRKLQDEAEKLKTQTPSQQFEDLLKNPYRSGGPLDPTSGIVRTAARQILRKKLDEGQIDIPDAAERDAIAKGYQGGVDPIEVFRKRFGEDPLQDLDEIADELNRARDFKEIDKILKRNKLFDIEPKKDYGYQEGSYTDEEMAALLKKSEEDPEGFAKGGKVEKGSPKIFDQLEMDVPHPYGHRTKFQEGGIFSGPAYQQYSQARSQAYENAPSKFQYDVMSNQAAGQFLQDRTKEVMGNNMFSKIVGGIGSAAAIPFAVGASPFHEAIQAKERMEPGSGFRGYMKAFLNEQPLRTAMNRGIGVAASVPGVQELGTSIGEGIYDLLNKPTTQPTTTQSNTTQPTFDRKSTIERILQDIEPSYDSSMYSPLDLDYLKSLSPSEIKDELDAVYLEGTRFRDADYSSGRIGGGNPFFRYSPEYMKNFNMNTSQPLQLSSQNIGYGLRKQLGELSPLIGEEALKSYTKRLDDSLIDYYRTNFTGDTDLQKRIFGIDPQYLNNGGRVGFSLGSLPKGIQALAKQLNKKFGKGTIKTADEMERPQSAKDKEMFKEFESRNPNLKRELTDEEYEDFVEELGGEDYLESYNFDGTVGDAQRILKEQKDYENYMYDQYKTGKLDPQPGEKGRKEFLEKKLEEMEMSGDKRLMTRDEIEELSTFDLGTEMEEFKNNKSRLQKKYKGMIDDDLLSKMMVDDNPQRLAEVEAAIDQALELVKRGKSQEEVLDIMKQMTDRTKQAGGGLAYLMGL